MNHSITRRQFVGAATRGLAAAAVLTPTLVRSANEKLNIGVIGVSGRGAANLNGVSGENIVALCDVDTRNLAQAKENFPNAATYQDFRKMLERNDLDAVVVSAPDHCHAVCVSAALKSGRHVYCEKPLARTVSEVRKLTELAKETGLKTQMGNQIHSHPSGNYRRVVELIQSGAIGDVHDVRVWSGARYGKMDLNPEPGNPPESVNYDLWLGPVPYTPYRPEYIPFNWRNFWAFGGGTLADFWCHFSDLPFWALELGAPSKVSAKGADPDPVFVTLDLEVTYEFPNTVQGKETRLTWSQGKYRPTDVVSPELLNEFGSGVLFMGDKGQLIADYTRRRLLPESDFEDFKEPDPWIANSIGHHAEWIHAIKNGGKSGTDFSYSGPLTEAGLLGIVAHRSGCDLNWNSKKLKALGCPEADQYIHHEYRDGWSL